MEVDWFVIQINLLVLGLGLMDVFSLVDAGECANGFGEDYMYDF